MAVRAHSLQQVPHQERRCDATHRIVVMDEGQHTEHAHEERALTTTDIEVAQECTFRPQLNVDWSPGKGERSAKPPGYSQAVGRMRRAQEEREMREAEEATIATQRAQVRPLAPPRLRTVV